MAIFEKTNSNQSLCDDTEMLSCTLETTQNIDKHTEYIIRVQRGCSKENQWNVSRRYRDFAGLQAALQQAGLELPLPPKKLIGNMQPSFIAERQIALQNYINEVLKHQILSLSLPVRRFLDPKNYAANFEEQALQTVSIALRGDGRYELKGPLPNIGWRIRKHYFLVSDTESKTDCILTYQSYGPYRHFCDKDLQSAFKSLQALTHPYIEKVLVAHNLETGAYVVRKLYEKGSIKDMLYGTDFKSTSLSKYGNPKTRKPFTMGQLAHYGQQILQALKFLHDKGLPHGHIHPGNIAVENQKAILMELENWLVGAPSIHRRHLVKLKRTTSAESIDVYSFGRTLYEMAFAQPLDGDTCDKFPEGTPVYLENLLLLCLSPARKHTTTLQDLLQHEMFSRTFPINGVTEDCRPHLKFTASLKDALKSAVAVAEAKLKSDQKTLRSARREVLIQEILSSEEEIRNMNRQKRRERKWKAESVRSHSVSTASSPTPPHIPLDTARNSTTTPLPPPSQEGLAPRQPGRAALLDAICGFDKSRLARVNSQ